MQQKARITISPTVPDALLLEQRLRAGGWEVSTCESPFRILFQLATSNVDAVLLDIARLAGREADAIAEMRSAQPDLCLAMAGSSGEPPPQAWGIDEYFALPLNVSTLIARLERCVAWKRAEKRNRELDDELQTHRILLGKQTRMLQLAAETCSSLTRNILSLQDLLRTAVSLATKGLNAERGSVMLFEGETEGDLRVLEAKGLSEEVISQTRIQLGDGVAGWVAKEGKPIVGGRKNCPVSLAASSGRYKNGAFISVPLMIENRVLGVLNVAEKSAFGGQGSLTAGSGDASFSKDEVDMLCFIAEQLAPAMERARAFERAQELSLTDELTGLFNRRYFLKAVQIEIARARRDERSFSIAILDIDHFKCYNDTCGHPAGDELLKEFAKVIVQNVRSVDVVCRYGGEEFGIIFPESGKGEPMTNSGSHFTERLRAAVEEHKFRGEERQPSGRLTVSGGVAMYPGDSETPEELLAIADRRLYAAKAQGRNRVYSNLTHKSVEELI